MSEETKEKKFRINMKQNAKKEWYGEFTVRTDDYDEAIELTKQLKEQVISICEEKDKE